MPRVLLLLAATRHGPTLTNLVAKALAKDWDFRSLSGTKKIIPISDWFTTETHFQSGDRDGNKHIIANVGIEVRIIRTKTLNNAILFRFSLQTNKQTDKHMIVKLPLEFFYAVVTPTWIFILRILALMKVRRWQTVTVLQRKMLRSIVGCIGANGNYWRPLVKSA